MTEAFEKWANKQFDEARCGDPFFCNQKKCLHSGLTAFVREVERRAAKQPMIWAYESAVRDFGLEATDEAK